MKFWKDYNDCDCNNYSFKHFFPAAEWSRAYPNRYWRTDATSFVSLALPPSPFKILVKVDSRLSLERLPSEDPVEVALPRLKITTVNGFERGDRTE